MINAILIWYAAMALATLVWFLFAKETKDLSFPWLLLGAAFWPIMFLVIWGSEGQPEEEPPT